MANDLRIDVDEARRDISSGALLVCAYADEAKCRKIALEGSMTLGDFEARAQDLDKNREIIFFCA